MNNFLKVEANVAEAKNSKQQNEVQLDKQMSDLKENFSSFMQDVQGQLNQLQQEVKSVNKE